MTTHPSADRLRSFALGTAAPDDLAAIETHLEACPACCGQVETIDDDRFLSRLRAAGRTPEPYGAVPVPAAVGGYRIERELGRGGMGVVYRAFDDELGRPVALKVMRPEVAARPGAADRFLREARAAARLESDHVVPIWHVGSDAGTPFIVMPLLAGESLADRLVREPVLPPDLIRLVGRDVAAGLAAAHDRGLVHRDVKPANVWLEGDPGGPVRRAKLLDFGLAWPADADTRLTADGVMVGSPGYMAPEQARGEPVGPRSDLFSLGVVLYRMATGRLPFDGPTVTALLTALAVDDPPPPPAAVPPAVSALIARLLTKNPAGRPASAAEVAEFLSESAAAPAPVRRKPGGFRVRVAAALAGLLAVAAAGVVITITNRDGRVTRIEVPDGAEVTVKDKDGKTLATVGPDARPPAAAADPDRQAAEWALAAGGSVRLDGDDRAIGAVIELPKDRFTLAVVDVRGRPVADADLARLRDLRGLRELWLYGTPVGDTGVAHLRPLTSLALIDLGRTKVTNAGLAHLAGLKGLVHLGLPDTAVTDAGTAHLSGLTEMRHLWLYRTGVGDAGLARLKDLAKLQTLDLRENRGVTGDGLAALAGMTDLRVLNLGGTRATDAGLGRLKGLAVLEELNLDSAEVTGAGLAHLKALPALKRLSLARTPVADADLAHLNALTGLSSLTLSHTKVTETGVAGLRRLTGLRELHLDGTAVDEAGVGRLRAVFPGCTIGPEPR